MKEIKAYIRRGCVNAVIKALDEAGAPGSSVVEIQPMDCGGEMNYSEASLDDTCKRPSNMNIVKLEVTCADHDVARLVQAIRNECGTRLNGDGWIFVTEVAIGLRIRDGASGDAALVRKRQTSRAA